MGVSNLRLSLSLAATVALLVAQPATAGEFFGGTFVHDVKTPFDNSGQEHGVDVHFGWRGNRIEALGFIGKPSPHLYAAVNSAGDTSLAAMGLDWKIGHTIYARPGIGLAVHDGPGRSSARADRIWFGSRVLFAPEVALGVEISRRMSIEAAWVHFSHAQLFGKQNPGTDSFGVRLNYRY